MKQFIKSINQYLVMFCFLIWPVCSIGPIFLSPAFGENSVADEIISLNVTEQPLGEVLEQISIAAGCQFNIDQSWADYPVTASFEDEPLYMGLKLIFRNINNAVIYGTDRTIRILFYEDGAPSSISVGSSFTIESPQEPVQMSQPFSEATAPQPEVELPDESRSTENLEQLPEEASESESETDESTAEDATETEDDSNTADSEVEQNEGASEVEDQQSDETDSTN
jgi:hypothetical protein